MAVEAAEEEWKAHSDHWAEEMSKTLRSIAKDDQAKSFLLQNQVLYGILLRAAKRFIGGET
jgi:hypothetical protein